MARERDYQLGVVISPDLGEDQARTLVDRISTIVANHDGRVIRIIAWGRRRLAYPIDHHRDGLYYWFDMQLPASQVSAVEQQLHVNEAVIRHLLTLRDSHIVAQERERAEEAEARAAQQAAEAQAAGAQAGQLGEAEAGAAMGERMGVETGNETGVEVAEAEQPRPAGTVEEAAAEAEGSAEG